MPGDTRCDFWAWRRDTDLNVKSNNHGFPTYVYTIPGAYALLSHVMRTASVAWYDDTEGTYLNTELPGNYSKVYTNSVVAAFATVDLGGGVDVWVDPFTTTSCRFIPESSVSEIHAITSGFIVLQENGKMTTLRVGYDRTDYTTLDWGSGGDTPRITNIHIGYRDVEPDGGLRLLGVCTHGSLWRLRITQPGDPAAVSCTRLLESPCRGLELYSNASGYTAITAGGKRQSVYSWPQGDHAPRLVIEEGGTFTHTVSSEYHFATLDIDGVVHHWSPEKAPNGAGVSVLDSDLTFDELYANSSTIVAASTHPTPSVVALFTPHGEEPHQTRTVSAIGDPTTRPHISMTMDAAISWQRGHSLMVVSNMCRGDSGGGVRSEKHDVGFAIESVHVGWDIVVVYAGDGTYFAMTPGPLGFLEKVGHRPQAIVGVYSDYHTNTVLESNGALSIIHGANIAEMVLYDIGVEWVSGISHNTLPGPTPERSLVTKGRPDFTGKTAGTGAQLNIVAIPPTPRDRDVVLDPGKGSYHHYGLVSLCLTFGLIFTLAIYLAIVRYVKNKPEQPGV